VPNNELASPLKIQTQNKCTNNNNNAALMQEGATENTSDYSTIFGDNTVFLFRVPTKFQTKKSGNSSDISFYWVYDFL